MKTFDIAIIGGGPAGLSAAINAASEGLRVGIFDSAPKFGGQSSESSLIENYLGFPEGVSGPELARLAVTQAYKFGVEFLAPVYISEILRCPDSTDWFLCSDIDDEYRAKVIIIATGVAYKRHPAKNLDTFLSRGVSYGAPSLSDAYVNKTVAVIGGANSAGQAAMHLASCSECSVKMIVRGKSLEDKMSQYLVDRLIDKPNVEILTEHEVIAASGEECGIRQLEIKSNKLSLPASKTKDSLNINHVFVMIGAKPKTRWLKNLVALDKDRFILTGTDIDRIDIRDQFINRLPLPNEAIPGIFIAGDVRYGSVKRVAAAIGEGSAVVSQIHRYFSYL